MNWGGGVKPPTPDNSIPARAAVACSEQTRCIWYKSQHISWCDTGTVRVITWCTSQMPARPFNLYRAL